jgi:sensor histidine kinase YesM
MGLITVNFTKQDEQLQCQIIDNGVGRQKSSEIKTKKLINHKSVALSNINERIRIIKELYGENVSIEFRDLYQDGTPNGTHVIITMPLS